LRDALKWRNQLVKKEKRGIVKVQLDLKIVRF